MTIDRTSTDFELKKYYFFVFKYKKSPNMNFLSGDEVVRDSGGEFVY